MVRCRCWINARLADNEGHRLDPEETYKVNTPRDMKQFGALIL